MLFAKIYAPEIPHLNNNSKMASAKSAVKDTIYFGSELFYTSRAQNMLALDPEGRRLSHSLCFLDFCFSLENPQVMS